MAKDSKKKKADADADVQDNAENKKVLGVYTYIGAGAGSPRKTKILDRQEFIRGRATEVTDADVLAKVKGNPTFVEGEADEETLIQIDEDGEAAEKEQLAADNKMNKEFQKKHKAE